MGRFARYVRRRFAGFTPLAAFLAATLGLAAWLGYEALDAAASHRRTAEDVLSRHARMAAIGLTREVEDNLDDVLSDIFDDVRGDLSSRRRNPGDFPSAMVVGGDLGRTMRSEGCSDPCRGFRSPLALFRIDARTSEVEFLPDTLPPAVRDGIVAEVLAQEPPGRRLREGLITTSAGGQLVQPVVVGYLLWAGSSELVEVAYGFVARADALGELFQVWYEDEDLLPQEIAGDQPNDSLLYVSVRTPDDAAVFASAITYATAPSGSDTLDTEFGGLVVQAMIRPDAAEQLVIGGLPSSRLPLLAALLLLTLGVGIAAFVQLRREQTFQQLRDDFVSGVSHELRTPLAQIRMFAELQEAGMLRSDEDRKRAIAVIHRESRRLSHLVENILQFSRLRRTLDQRMPREEMDLAEALIDGVDAVTPLLEDRGMKLDLAARHGLRVVANREALTRIVVNLLDNAVKYGPKGQTVKVTVDRLNGSARLSVEDQGPGVPTADRERIWKAYRRLERDIKAQLPGTGIGLSVVSELAALLEGRAWVDDSEGGGARFVVELPLAATHMNGKREHEPEQEHSAVA